MPRLLSRHAVLALCASAALAACGDSGGGGGVGADAGRTSDVPASAQQSVAGLIAFLNDLIANSTNETGLPILLGDATLPTSDTIEPSN